MSCDWFSTVRKTLYVTVLLVACGTAPGQTQVALNGRITYFDVSSVNNTSWQMAADRCQEAGMQLCMKKNLCVFARRMAVDVPRRFIQRFSSDKYVAVADTYNEWLYIGPQASKRCQRITEVEGPPVWKGKWCSDAERPSGKFTEFCQASSGFYCCKTSTVVLDIASHPIIVYIGRFQIKDIVHYTFSLEPQKLAQNASLKTTKASTDLDTFSLMSRKTDGKFEDPIFFCQQSNANGNNYVSDKWCPIGWSMKFFLYGSLSQVPESQRYEAKTFGFRNSLRTTVTSQRSPRLNDVSFVFYGPKFEDEVDKAICRKESVLITSESGIISSKGTESSSVVECRWKIRAQPNSIVQIKFTKMSMAGSKASGNDTVPLNSQHIVNGKSPRDFYQTCPNEHIEITGYGRFCGSKLPPAFFTIDNEVDIAFIRKQMDDRRRPSAFSLSFQVVHPRSGLVRMQQFEGNVSWTSAYSTCGSIGKTLCRSRDICDHTGSRPFYGIHQNDQWTPILDEYNDWIQIGIGNVRICSRHNAHFGPPLWGDSGHNCTNYKNHIPQPCPKRNFIYCCDQGITMERNGRMIDIQVYSIIKSRIVFSKYIRKGIDHILSFDNMKLNWIQQKRKPNDYLVIKLNSHHTPVYTEPIYFCQKEVVPAIGNVRLAYTMTCKPCENQGAKYLYHMYGTSSKMQNHSFKYYVGMYNERPHHSRVQSGNFTANFTGEGSFILYSHRSPETSSNPEPTNNIKTSACGGNELTLTAPATIMTPGYPISYEALSNCRWIVRKPNGTEADSLKLTVRELDLEDPVDVLTISEYTEISNNPNAADEPARVQSFSGMVNELTMTTTGFFELAFKSDRTVSKKGFLVEVTVVGTKCGGEVRINGDYIESPNYPASYPPDVDCEWRIEAPSIDYDVQVKVVALDLGRDEDCNDHITILHNTSVTTLCRSDVPKDIISLGESSGTVRFKSSGKKKGGKGFVLQVIFEKRRQGPIKQCGVQSHPFQFSDPVQDKIVGGSEATIENFPWMVHIHSNLSYCAGNLVSDRFVLTASHCLIDQVQVGWTYYAVLKDRAETYRVIAGRSKRKAANPGEQTRKISHLAIRRDYHQTTYINFRGGFISISSIPYNDIIMVKMDQPMTFTPKIQPICLPTQDAHVGDTCYIAGWGDVHEDRTETRVLHYTKVPILETELCNTYELMEDRISDTGVCAGYPLKQTGICFGDSGGPLFCRGQYGNFYLNGIASWSNGCARIKQPDVFTRVYKYRDWIGRVLKEHEFDPDTTSTNDTLLTDIN